MCTRLCDPMFMPSVTKNIGRASADYLRIPMSLRSPSRWSVPWRDFHPCEQVREIPPVCMACEFRESCHGGCAGRRRLQGALHDPDTYCPIVRGEHPRLKIRMASNRDLPKLSSSCTTVVIAR